MASTSISNNLASKPVTSKNVAQTFNSINSVSGNVANPDALISLSSLVVSGSDKLKSFGDLKNLVSATEAISSAASKVDTKSK